MLTEEQKIEARHKLAAGRVLAYRKMPYYTRALTAIETFEREGLGTFGVDKHWRLYYDPAKCLEWTAEEIAAVWLHEVNHLIRDHNRRFESLDGSNNDQKIFNQAADASINTDLKKQNIVLPNPEVRVYVESKLSPNWRAGMTAEQMYWEVFGSGQSGDTKPDGGGNPQNDESDSEEPEDSGSSDGEEVDSDASQREQEEQSDFGEETQDDGLGKSESEPNADGDPSDDLESDDASDNDGEATGSDSPNQEGDQTEGSESESGGSEPNGESDESNGGESGDENDPEDGESGDADGLADGDLSASNGSSGADSGDDPEERADGNDGQQGDNPGASDATSDCGSCVGGSSREYEDPTDDRAMDEYNAEWVRKKTAEDIVNHENMNPGSVPGDTLRDAQFIIEPQVDWREEFIALARRILGYQQGNDTRTFRRVSRRGGTTNIIKPAKRSPQPPQIAAILDTSGSMREDREIAAGLGELEVLLNRFGRLTADGGMHIINCDAQATASMVRDLKSFEVIGGGGTDMRMGIKLAAEMRPRMDIIVTVTDGGTPWPKDKPLTNPTAHYVVLLLGAGKKGLESAQRSIPEWMHTIPVVVPERKRIR